MIDVNGGIRPRLAFISFVVRGRSSVHDEIDYDYDHDLNTYIGFSRFGSTTLGMMQPKLPPRWQDCILRCQKFGCRELVGTYISYRYLIHFDQNKVAQTTQLLFGDNTKEAVWELARSIVGSPMPANIRPERFAGPSFIDFAIIAVTDVTEEGNEQRLSDDAVMTPQDAIRLARILRKATNQDRNCVFPSQLGNVVFSTGGGFCKSSEFAIAAMFMSIRERQFMSLEKREKETLVPRAVIDWLDFVDKTQVMYDMSEELTKTEIGKDSVATYIDGILAANGEEEFETRYLKPREAFIAKRIEFAEYADELVRSLQSNVFGKHDPPYFRKLDLEPERSVLDDDFAESVSSEFTNSAKKFDLTQSRFKSRDERVSEYLRDVVDWRVAQASNRLAKKMEALTIWLLLLAILTVLTALITDDIKKELYQSLLALWRWSARS